MWEEGDRYPDLILELLSPSTAEDDYGAKKRLYQDVFQTSEYFLYKPDSEVFDGFRLLDNAYQGIPRSDRGRRWSRELEVEVGIWHGEYDGQTARWLRLFYPDGSLVPTKDELVEQERQEKEQERQEKEAAELRAAAAERRAEAERREKKAAERRAEAERREKEQERRQREAAERRAAAAEIELARLRARYAPDRDDDLG